MEQVLISPCSLNCPNCHCAGRLDVWNLSNDTEQPADYVVLEEKTPINSVRWTQDGRHIAAGDADGMMKIGGCFRVYPCFYQVGSIFVTWLNVWPFHAPTKLPDLHRH